jgi:pimeloyl-ACP methyl ester carboxylesterase
MAAASTRFGASSLRRMCETCTPAVYDLRGHGMSEAPLEPEHYTDDKLWADDVASIINELRLDRPVLVGWSYGAFAICDYIRAYGQERIAAIDFVEGAAKLSETAFGTLIGPGFLDHFVGATADDVPTNIQTMRSFVRTCLVKPVSDDDLETAVCWNVLVPSQVRASLGAREIDCEDVLRSLEVPLLVTQGRATPWCYRGWPSTSWPRARPPRPPGTTVLATPRTWRSPSASTASWRSSPAASRGSQHDPVPTGRSFGMPAGAA